MLTALREFVLLGDGAAPEVLREIDDRRFGIRPGATSRSVRRTWIDTFDWRLFRAGLTLELRAGRGSAELLLTGRDGQLVASEQLSGRFRWPSLVEALPAGPLREQLAPVAGVRALMPVTRATSVLTELRAVNEDEKTIAILTLDRMSVSSGSAPIPDGQLPARLAIVPLRGYQPQATRFADALERLPGVTAASASPFETALAATARRPGDYTGKIDVQLTGTMPVTLALTTVLGRLFTTVEANLAGTIGDIDTEFLHDLRVAVRRTRSVLKSSRAVLPDGLLHQYRPEFKWLGDLTTPTRDLDVYLLGYSSMATKLVAATDGDLRPFKLYLTRQRATAQRQLVRGLRSSRFTTLAAGWRRDLEQVSVDARRRPTAATFAATRIARAHRRVLTAGAAIDQASPPQALHDLRKFCKELRYLLEVFASLHDPAQQWRAVNELKALQDCLGEYQDTEVQLTELRDFAGKMMADQSAPAQTLLAMGEIAADLARRQSAARSEFAGRFAEFTSPSGQARIGALGTRRA